MNSISMNNDSFDQLNKAKMCNGTARDMINAVVGGGMLSFEWPVFEKALREDAPEKARFITEMAAVCNELAAMFGGIRSVSASDVIEELSAIHKEVKEKEASAHQEQGMSFRVYLTLKVAEHASALSQAALWTTVNIPGSGLEKSVLDQAQKSMDDLNCTTAILNTIIRHENGESNGRTEFVSCGAEQSYVAIANTLIAIMNTLSEPKGLLDSGQVIITASERALIQSIITQ